MNLAESTQEAESRLAFRLLSEIAVFPMVVDDADAL